MTSVSSELAGRHLDLARHSPLAAAAHEHGEAGGGEEAAEAEQQRVEDAVDPRRRHHGRPQQLDQSEVSIESINQSEDSIEGINQSEDSIEGIDQSEDSIHLDHGLVIQLLHPVLEPDDGYIGVRGVLQLVNTLSPEISRGKID